MPWILDSLGALCLGYFLGAMPFGYWLMWLWQDLDVRALGSGNIGATNVWRSGGKVLGGVTLLLDALKGAGAVWIATTLWPDSPTYSTLAGAAAVVGHVFPIFLRFRGGKGVATYLGVVCALSPWLALMGIGFWIFLLALSRRAAVASLGTALLGPLLVWIWPCALPVWGATGMALFLIWTHQDNIRRLLNHQEKPLF